MRKLLILAFLTLGIYSYGKPDKKTLSTARAVIERTTQQPSKAIKLQLIPKHNGCDVFEQEVINGKLILKGSSGVALSRAFYDFIKNNNYGQVGWSGSRIDLPQSFDGAKTRNVISPVEHHFYFNVVTFGYSTPYWDWERWQKEIDWMALHGIDMPLALVANEAISTRVWKKLGLTDDEISAYLVGPAHFPWMRMGNISGIDSPLPTGWHDDQVALQHKILDRMKALGMKPICPGFAGFVPQTIKRIYPGVKLVETSWNVFHNWMISPQEELFSQIGKMFIEEWEKEFGKNDHYIVDSFNEMDVPFPPTGTDERYTLLASYGDKVYNSIKSGNPDAIWVMQGWMFGYQRYIWDYETLQALVSKVPDDKMLLLDLAADYNANFWKNGFNWDFYKGFYNKPWVYSVIPNMGGKTGFTGILDFYANGHLQALNSPNKGKLIATGMAPEGIENNEVVYELITDAGWNNEKTDVCQWLQQYTQSRYGTYNEHLSSYWNEMLKSVYGTFTDHPRFNWQLRPGSTLQGTINNNEHFFKGIESFAACANEMKDNQLYLNDLYENTALYLGGKLEILVQVIHQAYLNNNQTEARQLEAEFERIALGADQLLELHPTLNLSRWIDFARKHGINEGQKNYYERNARRIVTVWGPPVDDYSARIWSGLIRDYYLPRWKEYFQSKQKNKPYNITDWELNWVEKQQGVSPVKKIDDPVKLALTLIQSTAYITKNMINGDEIVLGTWSEADFSSNTAEVTVNLPVDKLSCLKSIRFSQTRNDNNISIKEVKLIADGKVVFRNTLDLCVNNDTPYQFCDITSGMDIRANNGCQFVVVLELKGQASKAMGKIVLIEK